MFSGAGLVLRGTFVLILPLHRDDEAIAQRGAEPHQETQGRGKARRSEWVRRAAGEGGRAALQPVARTSSTEALIQGDALSRIGCGWPPSATRAESASMNSVLIGPGSTRQTFTPLVASSRRNASFQYARAALVAP